MADQPITVSIEGIAATLRSLTDAADDLERYKVMYAAGPAAEYYSKGFRDSLDYAVRRFGTNVTRLQQVLDELRDVVKQHGDDMIEIDTAYAHLHSTLSAQLADATVGDTTKRLASNGAKPGWGQPGYAPQAV